MCVSDDNTVPSDQFQFGNDDNWENSIQRNVYVNEVI